MVDVKGTKVGKGQRVNRKVHAGRYVHDEAYNEEQHDMGPWIEVTSTRVDAIRYDYQNRAVQVTWFNKPRERGYVYLDVPYERFRSFIRASSKGKYVNSAMNSFDYRPLTPDELDAPTNERRSSFGMGPRASSDLV
jgi:KTSC domain